MGRKKHVMVVDDEPHIVNLVKLSLDDRRFNVTGAYSAREAMRLLEDSRPDLIILDLMMPGVNGFDLCENLRQDVRTQMVPVIILSAKNQINDKLQAIDAGADDYLTKPFDPIELERRVISSIEEVGVN